MNTSTYDNYYEIIKPLLLKYKQEILNARLSSNQFEYFLTIFPKSKFFEINELEIEFSFGQLCIGPAMSVCCHKNER